MIKKLIILSFALVSTLMADFKSIGIEEFEKLKSQGAIIIDIRRAEEWKATGIIEGSRKHTFFDKQGRYNVPEWMMEFETYVKSPEQAVILVCARANRTKVVGTFLSEQVGLKEVYDLEGGITNGWIKKGKKTIKE